MYQSIVNQHTNYILNMGKSKTEKRESAQRKLETLTLKEKRKTSRKYLHPKSFGLLVFEDNFDDGITRYQTIERQKIKELYLPYHGLQGTLEYPFQDDLRRLASCVDNLSDLRNNHQEKFNKWVIDQAQDAHEVDLEFIRK